MKIKLLLAIAAISMLAIACEKEDSPVPNTPVSDDLIFSVKSDAVTATLDNQEVLFKEESIDTTITLPNVLDSARFYAVVVAINGNPTKVTLVHRGVTLLDTTFVTSGFATYGISYKVGAWFRVN